MYAKLDVSVVDDELAQLEALGQQRSWTGGPLRTRAAGDEDRPRHRRLPETPAALPSPVADNHCHLDIADGVDGDWLATADPCGSPPRSA